MRQRQVLGFFFNHLKCMCVGGGSSDFFPKFQGVQLMLSKGGGGATNFFPKGVSQVAEG